MFIFKNILRAPMGDEDGASSSSEASPDLDNGIADPELKEILSEAISENPDEPDQLENQESGTPKEDEKEKSPKELLDEMEAAEANESTEENTDQLDNQESGDLHELSDGQKVSLDELKSGFLMQSDYTKKTQEHSQIVKDFEAESGKAVDDIEARYVAVEKSEKEHSEKLEHYERLDFFLQRLEQENPDLHTEFANEANRLLTGYDNPQVSGMKNEIKELKALIQGKTTSDSDEAMASEDETTRNAYASELAEVKKSVIPRLERLGIKNIDEAKIQQAWIKNFKDDKTLEDTIYEVYAGDIVKLSASKAKVANLRNKQGSRKVSTIGSVKAGTSDSDGVDSDWKDMSWNEITTELIGELGIA